MTKETTKESEKTLKTISPFKEKALLEKEIIAFVNKFKSTLANQATRMSDFFEMSCFNHIVTFYENNDYTASIENLQVGKYRYKCSTSGVQSNFSHFKVTKNIEGKDYIFEIQHNLAVQSSHHIEIFTTPDISIIKKDSVNETIEYYDTKRRFCFVENKDLMTFCEVKQFNPFPELLFNFIGVVNELRKDILTNTAKKENPIHIAPSLMISGKPNKQAKRIKEELEKRYCLNIIFDIFHSGTATFSRRNVNGLKQTGTVSSK